MKEDNNFVSRVKRYSKVTTSLTSLAAQFAGKKYLNFDLSDQKYAAQITEILGNLKGPLMKVAQLSATIPDLLPEEYARKLAELQSNAPPMSWVFVKRRMKAELGENWEDQFLSFDREASFAASLGQVHKATMPNKENVACKLQYPDMASAVEADLGQLKIIFKIYSSYNKSIQIKEIYKEIEARLKEELDYRLEYKHLKVFNFIHQKNEYIKIPKVYEKISTNRLLVMQYLEGKKLIEYKNAPQKLRNDLAKKLFMTWYYPFYKYGIIHGDPHLGNYSVDKKNNINLFDFGCVRIFPATFVKGVIDLYFALKQKDNSKIKKAYEAWGFKDIDNKLMTALNKWALFLYDPILKNEVRRIQNSDSGIYGAKIAGEVHRELKKYGGVKPPREFVFMDRAAVGLGSIFIHLKAEINWYKLFHALIKDFSVQNVESNQKKALKSAGI
ncbi:MAG: AarF/UbiB family protein [Proteobacteria bacterium]|jgi:predicted unusual protein kinase regulating ubiquinone biosynthesis (AarF/ABC1/UbiB family)|nr:AarF/UbiB family protein [Pseudomonadota bacterium]